MYYYKNTYKNLLNYIVGGTIDFQTEMIMLVNNLPTKYQSKFLTLCKRELKFLPKSILQEEYNRRKEVIQKYPKKVFEHKIMNFTIEELLFSIDDKDFDYLILLINYLLYKIKKSPDILIGGGTYINIFFFTAAVLFVKIVRNLVVQIADLPVSDNDENRFLDVLDALEAQESQTQTYTQLRSQ